MKRHIALILAAGILIHTHALRAQENDAAPGTADQATAKLGQDFLSWKFGLFLHFNIATFNDQEWANGYEDPATFAPDKLDCGQWADAAKAAGMQYAVLTVKHTGGCPLWDSQHTTHDVTAFKNFKDGKGDVVREFVDAFRARGIKVGLLLLRARATTTKLATRCRRANLRCTACPRKPPAITRVHEEAFHRIADQLRPG